MRKGSARRAKWTEGLSRRDWLRLTSLGVVGGHARWFEALAATAAADPARGRACILLWMSGGPSQIGHLRPQARPRQRRAVQGDRHAGARPAVQRAPAQAGQAGQAPGPRPLDVQQGRRSRPGHLLPAHRLPAAGADPVSPARLAGVEGTGQPGGGAARLRQHRAVSRLQPGRLRRPASSGRSTRRCCRRQAGLDAAQCPTPTRPSRSRTSTAPRGRAARGWTRARSAARLAASTSSPSIPACPRRATVAYERAVRLMRTSAGKAFDLHEEPAARARPLRPEPVRPGLPAGPPAGRARRALRRGHARRPGGTAAGTRTTENFEQVKTCAGCSIRPGRRCWKTSSSVACWTRRWWCGWASSAARPRSTTTPAAITSPTPGARCCAAAASGGRSTARPAPTA